MTKDYSSITHISYRFSSHPTRTDAFNQLNNVFGDDLENLDALFTSTAKDTVHPDVIANIRTQIGDAIIKYAVESTDDTHIRCIVDNFTFRVKVHNKDAGMLRTPAQLEKYLQQAIDA